MAVYERDDYTCQVCGKRGGAIEAHHLDAYNTFQNKRFLVSNGVTLCVGCHDAFHRGFGRGGNNAAQFNAFQSLHRNGRIVITRVRRAGSKQSLKKLVSRIPENHKTKEVDWGKPVGGEAW